MKHTQEEILKALHIIKDVCEEHVDCENTSPFYVDDECALNADPTGWEINDDSVSTWKGLL